MKNILNFTAKLKTYSGCLADDGAANDIEKMAVHGLLGLSRTVAELSVQLLGYELVSQPSAVCILGGVLGELRIVSTCSSLVSSCVLGYIGETICRWRCNLSFSS